MYFEMAARDIRALPKLEGTVHVNIALIIKFMPNYFFNPGQFPDVPRQSEAKKRTIPVSARPARGLARFSFTIAPCLRRLRPPTSMCSNNNRPLKESLSPARRRRKAEDIDCC